MSRERLPDGTILERDADGEILGVYLDEETPLDVLAHRQRRRGPLQDGPRCPIPRPTVRPPAGPPVEPPIARVSDATWAAWEAERQRRIDAQPPPRRDARRRVAVALDAEYVDRDTASARCPICDGVLAIRFRGALIDLVCLDGCPTADVERAVGSVRS